MIPIPNRNMAEPLKRRFLTKTLTRPALLLVVALVVVVRESAVALARAFGHPSLGNLLGMFALLVGLLWYKRRCGLPVRLVEGGNRLMKDSALAFLPIAAGAIVLMGQMGAAVWGIVLVMTVSTLLPLWAFARLARRWLGTPP